MKKIWDISVPLSDTTLVWEGDPSLQIEQVSELPEEFNVSRLNMGMHVGTHIDAPLHLIKNGKSVDQFPVEILIGPAHVVQVADDVQEINEQDLISAGLNGKVDRLLIKTKNSHYWENSEKHFKRDFAGLSRHGAGYLVNCGVRLVGIDYLSISPLSDLAEPHLILMRHDVIILETLNLSKVEPGWYDLYCLPLNLIGTEAAPARAILVQ